jgi:hypothetical protein
MYDTSKRLSMPLFDNYSYILSRDPYAHIYLGIWLFGPPCGPEGGENIGKPSYFNPPPDIGFTLFTPIKGRSKKPWSGMSKLPAVQPLWLNFGPLPVSRRA